MANGFASQPTKMHILDDMPTKATKQKAEKAKVLLRTDVKSRYQPARMGYWLIPSAAMFSAL